MSGETMQIAVLTPVWKGSKRGGILGYTANVVTRLKGRGHIIDVYALNADRGMSDTNLRLAEPLGPAFVVKGVLRMLFRRYDAVFCNESRFTFLVAAAYALLRHKRVVYVVHTFPTRRELGLLGTRFYRAPFRLQDRGLFRVVFVSEQIRRHVAQAFRIPSAEGASVIRAAAPSAELVRREPEDVRNFRRSWGVEEREWLVLGLGLTILEEKAKGAALLIRAFGRLRVGGQPYKLMLTRKGHPIYWLRELAHESDLDEAVIFTQEIPDPMLALNACDLYAHVVLDEGLPLSLLEAMAAGKPIVASRRAGIPEVLEVLDDGVEGILIEPTVDEVVGAIRRLRDDEALRTRLGQAAGRRAAAMSWEMTTERYLDLTRGVERVAQPVTSGSGGRMAPQGCRLGKVLNPCLSSA